MSLFVYLVINNFVLIRIGIFNIRISKFFEEKVVEKIKFFFVFVGELVL